VGLSWLSQFVYLVYCHRGLEQRGGLDSCERPGGNRPFQPEDKEWIRDWLQWTVRICSYPEHSRTILGQPALTRLDGTTALIGDQGFMFLFNPSYRQFAVQLSLKESIGLSAGESFLLLELYPQKGRLIGKRTAGV
jgi:hypothetical protein